MYSNALKNKFIHFAKVTTFQILQHLNTDYGQITTHDLDLNMKKLHKEWSPANPIEDLFEQIRLCREIAVDNDPIFEAMAVRSGIANLEASGFFGDAIRDWRKRHEIKHTMVNFISNCKKADARLSPHYSQNNDNTRHKHHLKYINSIILLLDTQGWS
jgi:hypothetical protein